MAESDKTLYIAKDGSTVLTHAVLALAAVVTDVMFESCPCCCVGLGPHVDSCALAEFYRAAKKLTNRFEQVEHSK